MDRQESFSPRKLVVPVLSAVPFWALGVVAWQASGYIEALLNFAYIGTSVAVGLGLYAALPRRRKPWGRRLTLFLVGGYMLGLVGILGRENVQLEGVFFALLIGATGAALMHYLVAKVFGPLLFGRMWCGWACWTAAVLDLLPYRRPQGRLDRRWEWLRYAHFAASAALVFGLWYGLRYRYGGPTTALTWLLAGNGLYYASGIALAVTLRDNRAFCKYLCPITTILKVTSRFSMLKVRGDAAVCDGCGACVRACPMDIRVGEYVQAGTRLLSTECTLCQTCITACPKRTLRLSAGLDVGGQERLRRLGEGTAVTLREPAPEALPTR